MTSNAGSREASANAIGFTDDQQSSSEGRIKSAIERVFSPEFRNRLDATVTFGPLTPGVMEMIVEKFILQLEAQLAEQRVAITLEPEAREWLAAKGYDPVYGARPLARVVQTGRLIMPVYVGLGQGSASNDIPGPWPGKLVKGQWVSTNAHFFDMGFSCSFVYYSDDDGATWQTNKDGKLLVNLDYSAVSSYLNEPSVTEVKPGTLLLFLRSGLGRLFQAWSHDNGETWTRPEPTSLATSTAPGQIRTLPNGHLLAVWNQLGPEEIRRGYHRSRMSTAISRNGGSVWEYFQNVTSLHEETRVEPGPIEPVRPEEVHYNPDMPAPEREAGYVTPTDEYGVWTYPSVLVLKDRVIISHRYYMYGEHETAAQLVKTDPSEDLHGFIQKQKVLPLSWLYGGKEPADSPGIAGS